MRHTRGSRMRGAARRLRTFLRRRVGSALLTVFSSASCSVDRGAEQRSSEGPVWSLQEPPVYQMTAAPAGADSIVFHQVRDARFEGGDADLGSVVVAVQGEGRLVFLDPQGIVTGTVGRPGPGPGEFTSMSGLFRFGTDLAVWDTRNARVTFLSDRVVTSDRAVGLPLGGSVIGVFDDGTLVITGSTPPRPGVPLPQGNDGPPTPYYLWRAERIDTVFGLPEPLPVVCGSPARHAGLRAPQSCRARTQLPPPDRALGPR